jgi:DNA repair protein RadC
LAILLGRVSPESIQQLLTNSSLMELSEAEVVSLARTGGLARCQTRRLVAFVELSRRLRVSADSAAPAVTTPRQALLQFQDLRWSPRECFAVLYLNSRNQPINCERVAVGGLNIAAVHPREVFAPALSSAAAGVILAHNHPSGDPTPSPEDIGVTRHLKEAGRLLGVEVLDHLVISEERFRSLREEGLL